MTYLNRKLYLLRKNYLCVTMLVVHSGRSFYPGTFGSEECMIQFEV